ncbi:hypothetical protein [Azospirillum sp.]|uniref:hypothetical protein n=1 Tax=Azospirillum sp. TaxID=34012 RepID=UPI003D76169D
MRINLSEAEADVVEAAFVYVLYSDVVSRRQKREMLGQLAAMKQTLACAPRACDSCRLKPMCETRVLDIMAGAA